MVRAGRLWRVIAVRHWRDSYAKLRRAARRVVGSRLGLLLLGATACAEQHGAPSIECRSAALVGGSEQAEYVALAAAQQSAIAQLSVLDGDAAGAKCTAVLVAPQAALTAAHCVASQANTFALQFDLGPGTVSLSLASQNIERHPHHDLALLTWSKEKLSAVLPIPVDLHYPAALGDLLQLAGYGLTEQRQLGLLRYSTAVIVERSAGLLRVSGERRAGACAGDSGGPALSRSTDGSVRVVGILSAGAASCAETDVYTRLSDVSEWLTPRGVQPGPAVELADCRFVGEAGRCFGDAVLHCNGDDTPNLKRCTAGTRCGFDHDEHQFRCVEPAQDACDGLGDLGACEGDERVSCEDGVIQVAPCGACGATCKRSVQHGRAICTP